MYLSCGPNSCNMDMIIKAGHISILRTGSYMNLPQDPKKVWSLHGSIKLLTGGTKSHGFTPSNPLKCTSGGWELKFCTDWTPYSAFSASTHVPCHPHIKPKPWLLIQDISHNLITYLLVRFHCLCHVLNKLSTFDKIEKLHTTPSILRAPSFCIARSTATLNLGCSTRSGSVSSGNSTIPVEEKNHLRLMRP